MPKPNAIFFGSGKKEFGFLRIPDIDYKLETPDLAPTALVKVTGSKLSVDVVESELAKILWRIGHGRPYPMRTHSLWPFRQMRRCTGWHPLIII